MPLLFPTDPLKFNCFTQGESVPKPPQMISASIIFTAHVMYEGTQEQIQHLVGKIRSLPAPGNAKITVEELGPTKIVITFQEQKESDQHVVDFCNSAPSDGSISIDVPEGMENLFAEYREHFTKC